MRTPEEIKGQLALREKKGKLGPCNKDCFAGGLLWVLDGDAPAPVISEERLKHLEETTEKWLGVARRDLNYDLISSTGRKLNHKIVSQCKVTLELINAIRPADAGTTGGKSDDA